jgi:hypothetical protein
MMARADSNGPGHGGLRASDADREQAGLAAVTADIPAEAAPSKVA